MTDFTEYTVCGHTDGKRFWYTGKKMTDFTEYTVREYTNGTRIWRLDNKLNRLNGPAIERASGQHEWWLDGQEVTEEEHARLTSTTEEMTLAQVCKALGKNVKIVKG